MAANKLTIIDIVTSAIRAMERTLRSLSNVSLEELPEVRKEETFSSMIHIPEGVYTSFVYYSQEYGTKKVCGGVLVNVTKTNLSQVFGALGITDLSPDAEIRDACGEFCNIIAGVFKTEMVNLGYDDVQLSVPEGHADSISDILMHINNLCKYKLNFAYKGRGIVTVDVFMGEA
jgi:hypothetical protein